jgi:hypothetical protein
VSGEVVLIDDAGEHVLKAGDCEAFRATRTPAIIPMPTSSGTVPKAPTPGATERPTRENKPADG